MAPGNKKGNIKFGKGPGLQCPENYTVIDLTQKLFFTNFYFFPQELLLFDQGTNDVIQISSDKVRLECGIHDPIIE